MDESWLAWCNAVLWLAITARFATAPGVSYTSLWLFVGLQALVLGSADVWSLYGMVGFGVITGWYGIQLVDGQAWNKIMVMWIPKFPGVSATSLSLCVRVADLCIHLVPFLPALHMNYSVKHGIQALLLDRMYFLAIDGQLIGNGRCVAEVYGTPTGPRFFYTLQALAFVGYAAAVLMGFNWKFITYSSMILLAVLNAHIPNPSPRRIIRGINRKRRLIKKCMRRSSILIGANGGDFISNN